MLLTPITVEGVLIIRYRLRKYSRDTRERESGGCCSPVVLFRRLRGSLWEPVGSSPDHGNQSVTLIEYIYVNRAYFDLSLSRSY